MISQQKMRMGWSFWIVLLLVAVVSAQDTQLRQSYTSEEINADLDRMQQILTSMHPGLHLYITPEDLNKEFASIRLGSSETQSLRNAFLKFAALVDKVRCGHTYALSLIHI